MYFKLSFKNVKKSFKDYSLYFLTLTFGVCIFYIFNSIEAQKAMMNISQSASDILQTLTKLMGIISIFISIILGFLIVYANNFIIRRRKKEIGVYMTLGMEKGNVARLLVAENFLIGVLSLGAGLLAGIFMSQGLSVVTAKLFEVDMTSYRFIFSPGACAKTIIYFGLIFIVVMAASTFSVSKYKLIDLLNAEKQNEKQKLRNPVITVILFILSVALIGAAYALVLKNGIGNFDRKLAFEIILGAAGTFLFFASLSGFFLRVLQSDKKLYFKGLNMFILRQINSRINTAHISMSFICLMLFCTIGILSTGLGMNNVLNSSYKSCTPYDASFWSEEGENISKTMQDYGFDINKYTDNYVEFATYEYSKENLANRLVFQKVIDYVPKDYRQGVLDRPIFLLKVSDYNKLMKLKGKSGINLSDNQIAFYSDYAEAIPELKEALSEYMKKYTVTISQKTYNVYPELRTDGIVTSPATDLMLAFIVPDKLADGSRISETMLSLNLRDDSKTMQRKFESDIYAFADKNKDKKAVVKISAATRLTINDIAAGSKAIIAFVGIYIGIIFLLTSAAILALQQLSEAADNRQRYTILQKVGADESLINSALFKQIAIYFMLPLSLACIHSVVGIKVANDMISQAGGINALGNIIITAVLITIVYGAYFLATYFSSKRIILNSRR